MRAHPRDVFQRNAQAIDDRSAVLVERGRSLQKIGLRGQKLQVQAVLVAPERALAVISGQLLTKGDEIADASGGPAIEVVEIARNAVTLRLEGTEFVRELGR